MKKWKFESEVEKWVGMGTQQGQEQQDRCQGQRKTEQRQDREGSREQCGKEVFWFVSRFPWRDKERLTEGRGGEPAASSTHPRGCSSSLGS